jgi:dihydropteroate synthase
MKNLEFGKRTLIMGIVNITPDSFYDGGRHADAESAFIHAIKLLDEGADIIDIGGESSRPGAAAISEQEELDRVCPVVERVHAERPDAFISIDTVKPEVAKRTLSLGVRMINDITGLAESDAIARLCAEYNAYIVLMHMRGTPRTMQNDTNTVYSDLCGEISSILVRAAEKALNAGVRRENIIIDPGIGFAKTTEQNYEIISHLDIFGETGYPVLMALSRKALIGNIIGKDADRLPATIALNAVSALRGACIIRVHDVKEHVSAMKTVDLIRRTA